MRASFSLARAPLASVPMAERQTSVAAPARRSSSGSKGAAQSRLSPLLGTATTPATSAMLPPLQRCCRGSTSASSSSAAAAASSSSPSPSSPSPSSSSSAPDRHAPLHDFCALIPYGFLIGVAALVSLLLFGAGDAAGVCAAASASSLISARMSLSRWRLGGSCAPVTAAAAAVATSAALWFYRASVSLAAAKGAAAAPVSLWSLRSGGVLSAAVAAILWGNLLLGGNAPRRKAA